MQPVILFDFYGVFHDDPLKVWSAKNGFSRDGAIADTAYELDSGHISYQTYLERLAAMSQQTVEQLLVDIDAPNQLNTELVQYVETLIAHYPIALITNAAKEEVEQVLLRHNLFRLFDTLIISSEVGHAKPEPEIFTMAIEELDALPKHAVFIDDTIHNVEGAKALGIRGIVFEHNEQLQRELEQALQQITRGL